MHNAVASWPCHCISMPSSSSFIHRCCCVKSYPFHVCHHASSCCHHHLSCLLLIHDADAASQSEQAQAVVRQQAFSLRHGVQHRSKRTRAVDGILSRVKVTPLPLLLPLVPAVVRENLGSATRPSFQTLSFAHIHDKARCPRRTREIEQSSRQAAIEASACTRSTVQPPCRLTSTTECG